LTVSGRIVFLPWVTIPEPVTICGFRFAPTPVEELGQHVASEIATEAAKAIRTHVGRSGRPIESCTLVQRARRAVRWDVPARLLPRVYRASELLALCCLAEQRFMEGHSAPHLNASMFRAVSMHVAQGHDGMSMTFPRRGNTLRMGGLRFADTLFQQPSQVEGTRCEVVNLRLARAIEAAQRGRDEEVEAIGASLEFFLLANAETPELEWDSCAMLSAMAFEQLIGRGQSSAVSLAEAFARLWSRFSGIPLGSAKRIGPDHRPEWMVEQRAWPIHRKWMKELYEARSARAHRGQRRHLSSNWAAWQHVVIAAFVYPLAIKLMLSASGRYVLDSDEEVACETLDDLLDSDWGSGWRRPPEWPSILSRARGERQLRRAMEQSMREAGVDAKTE
jgi:hypothetical protein